jgi:GNAT superfamily N-acetyltransferase
VIEIQVIREGLPPGFEVLRYAADDEAFRMLGVLAEEWANGTGRFDGPGEMLVAALDGPVLAGVGGMSRDPVDAAALRMRRFYVYPPYRRRGVGRAMARFLLERPEVDGRAVTLNAPHAEAARFWQALGFIPDARDGHTHILPAGSIHI